MFLTNLIASLAGRMPYVVQRARFFKHFRTWPALKCDIQNMKSMGQYVAQHGLENRDNPRWGIMADKYAVREEIDRILGPGHLIPLLGHWERPEDIDFDSLPDSFILKTNNGCGTNVFVHDKNKIDRQQIIRQLKKSLDFPYGKLSGQLHYDLIKPCVVAEEIIIQDGGHKSLTDWKIHCVNGEPLTIYVFKDRDEVNHFKYDLKAYTADWRELPDNCDPDDVAACPEASDKPEWLDEMLEMARKLSEGEEFVRIDFYQTNGKILFGEMTYTPDTIFNSHFLHHQKAMSYLLNKIKEGRL